MYLLIRILIVSLFSLPVWADEYLANVMQHIAPPQSQLAINIWDIEKNSSVYSINEQTLMQPASIQKLLTAVAATKQLGTDFYYETQVYIDGVVVQQQLNGDVYIKFSGDPSFTREQLKQLLTTLKTKDIQHINGNVILVSPTSESLRAPGWVWDDLGICYAAPVSDFIIDKNCVRASLSPLADNASEIIIDAQYPVEISTKAVFKPNIDVTQAKAQFCELHMQRFDGNRYRISGCYPGNQTISLAVAVNDPSRYAKDVVKAILNDKQVNYANLIISKQSIPPSAQLLATHQSEKLPKLLKIMLEKSDNLIADSLLKNIGQDFYRQTFNSDNIEGLYINGFTMAAKALQSILIELNLPFNDANLVDGSGLSRYNLLTSAQMLSVLQLIDSDTRFQYLTEFLPISGKSGTLKYQQHFNKPPLKAAISAKTGTMLGVENLAGFIQAKNGKHYAFVIIENGLTPDAKQTRLAPFSALLLRRLYDLQP
ncbi:D-alanyl-D-alanine carboxypeptidase/D-alanyl-D-alanine-endopeptidase [Shewanella sp. 10N.286.52.C2]|uniref:D-alanyl-D-alanine carboxypeptidase/D-alanyl-D-alanine endopeptidase n=1 Tax=Shewanella sp. 10N.286.52.C2 TaxID=1880838 RepID=UPI000C818ABB|nr:D-alanyl-D-alanine carboxypeptidase/D-alanyl-D-alanine-endopeptidase [Shewanella sp. 10N.286.52.C2]PMG28507.1 D-alanyl-D-alanine carboxypeptidase/D-alanyl-D-alanine-endopeptidase [Shewanella sp. 10N.286.52.C2]